jgi:hypothetical protein
MVLPANVASLRLLVACAHDVFGCRPRRQGVYELGVLGFEMLPGLKRGVEYGVSVVVGRVGAGVGRSRMHALAANEDR